MQKEELQEVYEMVDSVPFSRGKKNIHRDFADAVMMAELIYHYNPKLVELHNYPPANSLDKKIQNWSILNSKVLKKMGFNLTKSQIEQIATAVPGLIEELLYQILLKFEKPDQEGTLSENSKVLGQKRQKKKEINQQIKQKWPEEQIKKNKQFQSKKEFRDNHQAEQILKLVNEIDDANDQLSRLQKISQDKDEIVRNLQKQLQKIIFA